jgi:glycosyltransferase involved in cell wall biosynthesis
MSRQQVAIGDIQAALRQRLDAVAPALDVAVAGSEPTPEVLQKLVDRVIGAEQPAPAAWLLFAALTGSLPKQAELGVFRRALSLAVPGREVASALEATLTIAELKKSGLRRLELVTDTVFVDVTFCAQHDHNTGIQRVVRATLPRWQEAGHGFRLARWSPTGGAYRALTEREIERVMDWKRPDPAAARTARAESETVETVLVPWGTTVFLPEVPSYEQCSPLAALGESSNNRVVLIGYDAIPIVSADTVPNAEASRFAQYLDVVKHADGVAGISESAADEFRGFAGALPVQGLVAPDVTGIPLAVDVPAEARAVVATHPVAAEPLVICVGSHEPRKNQEAVLYAAENLFRRGLDFRMVFVGGGSRTATASFDRNVTRLQKEGMKVESYRRLGDDGLWQLFADARFSVFVSKHEGFGLPVAESLSLGTPVLSSDFGSIAEIAAGGGCLMVDPRDDERIEEGMRALLTDDTLIERLRGEISGLAQRSWAQYADELWEYTTSVEEKVR